MYSMYDYYVVIHCEKCDKFSLLNSYDQYGKSFKTAKMF